MSNTKLIGWIAVGALILSVFGLFMPGLPTKELLTGDIAGAPGGMLVEQYDPYWQYNDGLKSEKAITLSGANGDITSGDDITAGDDLTVTDDLTISGGRLDLTTTNTATSTLAVGCIQTTATSTATAIRMLFHATTTPSTALGVASGFVAWGYGSCPI